MAFEQLHETNHAGVDSEARSLPADQPMPAPSVYRGDGGGSTARPSSGELLRHMIEALARVRQVPAEEIAEMIRGGGGDLRIDSKEGETVIAILVAKLGCDLPGPSDLKREQFSSIRALLSLVEHKLLP